MAKLKWRGSFESYKRKEFSTYRALKLHRDHKARARRENINKQNIFLYIGGDTPDRPYLKVLKTEYRQAWYEITRQVHLELHEQGFSQEQMDDLTRRKIERLIYERLSRHSYELESIETKFEQDHGRRMTPHEMSLYAKMLKDPKRTSHTTHDPQSTAVSRRKHLLHRVLSKISEAQRHQPAKLQQAWATAVGEEIAQESTLEAVNKEKGIAICRCLNATLSFQLRRRKEIAPTLSKLLEMNIRKVVFR